jgi:hypothetical protein
MYNKTYDTLLDSTPSLNPKRGKLVHRKQKCEKFFQKKGKHVYTCKIGKGLEEGFNIVFTAIQNPTSNIQNWTNELITLGSLTQANPKQHVLQSLWTKWAQTQKCPNNKFKKTCHHEDDDASEEHIKKVCTACRKPFCQTKSQSEASKRTFITTRCKQCKTLAYPFFETRKLTVTRKNKQQG